MGGRRTLDRKRTRGRPRTIPAWEVARGVLIEHYVMEHLARGRTMRQIAGALRLDARTIISALMARGYRFKNGVHLVHADTDGQPQGGQG